MLPFQTDTPTRPPRPEHYSEIVHRLHPGSWFYWDDDQNRDYKNLRLVEKVYDEEAYAKNPNGPLVMKPNPIKNLPTLDELNTELLRAQEEWDDRFDSYKRQRLDEYPSMREQLDMIYHDIDGWRETIKTIKDKYPKPIL